MNKKILAISTTAVFILVAIPFASAVNITTVVEKKESPLFGIRTRKAISGRIGEVIENIKTKYIGERVFFLPFQWLKRLLPHLESEPVIDWSGKGSSYECCTALEKC